MRYKIVATHETTGEESEIHREPGHHEQWGLSKFAGHRWETREAAEGALPRVARFFTGYKLTVAEVQ